MIPVIFVSLSDGRKLLGDRNEIKKNLIFIKKEYFVFLLSRKEIFFITFVELF